MFDAPPAVSGRPRRRTRRLMVAVAAAAMSATVAACTSPPPGGGGTGGPVTPTPTSTRTTPPPGGGPTGGPTTGPTATSAPPTSPGTPPPAGTHVDNPFTGATAYLNPDYTKEVETAAAGQTGDLSTRMRAVAGYPTAVWLDRIAAIDGGSAAGGRLGLTGHLDAALAQRHGSTPITATFVIYDLPDRDCAALASNGELHSDSGGLDTYKTKYIDPIAAIFRNPKYAGIRIVTVVEPDSLPNLVTNLDKPECAKANSSGAYTQGVQYALRSLHAIPNVYTYVDIAHSGWLGWDSNRQPAAQLIANTVKGATANGDMSLVDGFISDTANYTPVEEPYLPDSNLQVGGQPVRSSKYYEWNPYFDESDYVASMYQLLVQAGFPSSVGMLIDTSRDGWGGPGRPTAVSTSTDLNTYVDASRIDRRAHRGLWCNVSGAGIGPRPAATPLGASSHVDAFVWVKPPGESDGTSNSSQTSPDPEGKRFDSMCDPSYTTPAGVKTGALPNAPSAGSWFPAQFEMLVRNAYPALG